MNSIFSNKTSLIPYVVASLTTLIIMWGMLLPGFVLTLDLAFTPWYHITHSAGSYTNSLPLEYLIHILYLIFPGFAIEKIILIAMFFLLSLLSFKYLPVPQKFVVKLFASLLYTANSFVYVRMLAGQWTHIFAYALLPLFIHLLSSEEKRFIKTFWLGVCIAIIGRIFPYICL